MWVRNNINKKPQPEQTQNTTERSWTRKNILSEEKYRFHQVKQKSAGVLELLLFLHCYIVTKPNTHISQNIHMINALSPYGTVSGNPVVQCLGVKPHPGWCLKLRLSEYKQALLTCALAAFFLTTVKNIKNQALKNHPTEIYATRNWRIQYRT